MPTIRTPDQRLRVFVSSTLEELAPERAAVSNAISALGLTPVMFELGARPHSPQEVYRAYLEQSDVFIGLYWQRYGWVAPGEDISGVQDELRRSQPLPRLLYVKAPAPERDDRLSELLDEVRSEGADSYRTFRTPGELGRLVRDDLAVLLSETFTSAHAAAPRVRRSLPVDTTSLIGRDEAIEAVTGFIEHPDTRLVTLTGPGGIGKTRLAVAVAGRIEDRYESGATFVPLASVATPELVLVSIASAVGADLARTRSPLDALVEHFGDAPALLVLDNLERVVAVAPDLDEILTRSPGVKILATSRIALRLRAEREYPVDELESASAVELFVDRARAVRPDFALDAQNAPAVTEICRRLEGVPLAIELAAARIRLLDPAALLDRLPSSLDATGTGPVDLPERQRTLRATIDWSVGLLDDAERAMLSTLSVFADGWTIDAATRVADLSEDRTLDLIDALARQSLVRVDAAASEPRFRMLETLRELVSESSAPHDDLADVRRRHATYFRELAEQADPHLRGERPAEWTGQLQAEEANLGVAIRWFLAHDVAPLPHLLRVLWLFWRMRGHLIGVRSWTDEALAASTPLDDHAQAELFWTAAVTAVELGDDAAAEAAMNHLAPLLGRFEDPALEAVAHLAMAWILPIRDELDAALREASVCHDGLRDLYEPFWTAVTISTLGALEVAAGRIDDALTHLNEARDMSQQVDSAWFSVSWAQLGTVAILQGRLDDARALLDHGLTMSLEVDSAVGVSVCLAAFARLALASRTSEQAALTLGAAEGLRRRVGMQAWPSLRRGEATLAEEILQAMGAEGFEDALARGSALSRNEAVALVRRGPSDRGPGGDRGRRGRRSRRSSRRAP